MADSVPEAIINAVFNHSSFSAITHDIGERFFHVHSGPHRVVAAPRGTPSEFTMPDRPGDAGYSDAGRILLLRNFLITWKFWDVDFASTEALMLKTVRLLRHQNHHTIVFSNEVWDDQVDEQDGWDKLGTAITLDTYHALPVYDDVPIRIPLTAIPQIVTTVQLPPDGSGETVVINE